MGTKHVDGWQGFLAAIAELRERYGTHERPYNPGQVIDKPNRLLFRGQPNEGDPLKTTLERTSAQAAWHVAGYLTCVDYYVHQLESFTGERWDFPDHPAREAMLKEKQDWMRTELPGYNYLVFLRQHGFPSPLLDWTESPFIAAYFAYINATRDGDCAVYCYIDSLDGIRGGKGGNPAIYVKGPHVTTDKRHFAQKAWYTIATEYKEGTHYFCSHESVFDLGAPTQDGLIKLVLPAVQRGNVLDALDDFNINHFTLFHSTDALVRAMASRAFDIGEHSQTLRHMRIRDLPPKAEAVGN